MAIKLKKVKDNREEKRKGSIFSLLINNYIFFTVIVIVSAVAISAVNNYLLFGKYNGVLGITEKYQKYLQQENYHKLNLKKIAGDSGTIEILDENYHLIYSQGKNINTQGYTVEEINAIPDYENNDTYLNIYDFHSEDGASYQIIIAEPYDLENSQKWFKVLDSKLNVILSSNNAPIGNEHYSEEEITYMTGYYNKDFLIEKYEYVNKEGKPRIAIIKAVNLYNPRFTEKVDTFTKGALGVFGAAYIICMILFVILLRSKFYEPLGKLNRAMQLLSEGKRKNPINYQGPKEFVDICDSFNVMVNKLEDSENQRRELMNEKERMMADISHDLKTPITSIQGYAKALSDGIIPEDDKEKYIKIIYEKSKKLTDLINIFHEYSKLEHPDFNLAFEKVDLSEYLRAYIALKYEEIVESGFGIEVNIPEEEMEVELDKLQFQRVLDNILGNSIKHNKKGSNIYVSLSKISDSYEIIIADDGKGIPREIAGNIFEAFTVGDESRNSRQGSGLGLAIAKTIVELHKGTIELVLDQPKEFSTEFKITLRKSAKL